MGTRGLLGLIIGGKRYAAYNQYDSYPKGLGKGIMDFFLGLSPEDWDKMLEMVKDIKWVNENSSPSNEVKEKYIQLGFCDLGVSSQSADDWYCLLRKLQGARLLPEILNGNCKHIVQSVKYLIKGGMYSEWAYFVDLEKKTFETWANGTFIEEVSLEGLSKDKAEAYLELMTKKGSKEEGPYVNMFGGDSDSD